MHAIIHHAAAITLIILISWSQVTGQELDEDGNANGCVFRGKCGIYSGGLGGDVPIPCVYNGKPKLLTNGTLLDRASEYCPLINLKNQPLACCDDQQLYDLMNGLDKVKNMVYRCPSCWLNFANFYCRSTCSPNQGKFMQVTKSHPSADVKGKDMVLEANFAVTDRMAKGLYDSCENVSFPGTGGKVMSFICYHYGEDCSPRRLLYNLGTKDPASYQTNYIFMDNGTARVWDYEEDMALEIQFGNASNLIPFDDKQIPCDQSPGLPGFDSKCSCSDCTPVCKAKIPPAKEFTIWGVNGQFIIMVFVFLGLALLVIFEFSIYFFLNSSRNEESIPFVSDDHNDYTRNNINNGDTTTSQTQDIIKVQINQMGSSLGYKMEVCLRSWFELWGRFCARNSILVIITGILIVGALSAGLHKFSVISDPVSLWSSSNSRSRLEREYYNEKFKPFYRVEQIIIKREDAHDGVIPWSGGGQSINFTLLFQYEFLETFLKFQNGITSLKANYNGEMIELDEICLDPMKNDNCLIQSPFEWFQSNLSNLRSEDYLTHFHSCFTNYQASMDTNTSLSCWGNYGGYIMPNVALGGYNLTAKDYNNATSLIITIPILNFANKTRNEKALAWEKVYLDYIAKFIETITSDHRWSHVKIAYYSERSLEDELESQSKSDITTIAISYIVMFIYVSIALGQFVSCDRLLIDSKITLGLFGVFIVLGSVTASVGTFSFLGVKATLIIVEVIPFLALAVGVDNIFIIVQEFQRDPWIKNEKVEDKVGKILGSVGPSLLIASLSESSCFFLGGLSNMPAVRIFALNAGLALLYDFLLQVTVFVALLSFETRRQQSNRFDVLCCLKQTKFDKEEERDHELSLSKPGFLYNMFQDFFAPLLMKDGVRMSVILIFLATFCASIGVFNKIDIGLDQELSMPLDSYVHQYFIYQKNELRVGPPYYIVVGDGLNYSNVRDQNLICGIGTCDRDSLLNQASDAAFDSERSYLATNPSSWLDDYFNWARTASCCQIYHEADKNKTIFCPSINKTLRKDGCDSCGMGNLFNLTQRIRPSKFYTYLDDYLEDIPTAACPKGGHPIYGSAVVLGEGNVVKASYYNGYHTVLKNSHDFISAMKSIYSLTEEISKKINGNRTLKSEVKIFPYSIFYVFYEQYLTMWRDTGIDLTISLADIFVVTFILLGFDLISASIIVGTIASIIVHLLGIMWLWDISLNAVSLVNLVMAVGISVEFCSHIIRAFAISQAGCRKARAQEALSKMGSSVLSGITITKFVGILILAFAKSQMLSIFYFRMFLSIVVIGALHGLILLPVLLSIFGGKSRIFKKAAAGINVQDISED